MSVDGDALGWALRSLVDLAGPPCAATATLVARLDEVVAGAATVLHVDGAALALLDEDDHPRLTAASDEVAARVARAQLACEQGPGIEALRSGIALPVDDLTERDDWADLLADLAGPPDTPVRAVLSAPVVLDGEVAGVLDTLLHRPHAWSPSETRATAAYADVIGLALRASARAGEVDGARRRLRAELDLGRAPGSTRRPLS